MTLDCTVRVLVCGSRNYSHGSRIWDRLRLLPAGSTVIHGGARGADSHAGHYAKEMGLSVEVYPADWDALGKRAGIVRNLSMLDSGPDLVIAFWDGESKGTAHTIEEARRRGVPVEVIG